MSYDRGSRVAYGDGRSIVIGLALFRRCDGSRKHVLESISIVLNDVNLLSSDSVSTMINEPCTQSLD